MKSFDWKVSTVWQIHMRCAHLASVHATVSRVFGEQMKAKYRIPVNGVWPPILWSPEFKSDPSLWEDRAKAQRQLWLSLLKKAGCVPKAIMLFAGRWSAEKRIRL